MQRPALVVGSATLHGWLAAIAVDAGLAGDASVDVVDFPTGRHAIDAMLAGRVHLAASSEFAVLAKRRDGADLRILAELASTTDHLETLARRDRGIVGPTDLRGRRIAVAVGTDAEYFLTRSLDDAGVAMDAVELVPTGAADLVAALGGRADAVVAWEPHRSRIRDRFGDAVVGWPTQGGRQAYGVLVAPAGLASVEGAGLQPLFRALVAAEDFAVSNPARAQAIMARRLGVDGRAMAKLWGRFAVGLGLSQGLFERLADQARWLKLTDDVRASAWPEPLRSVKPGVVAPDLRGRVTPGRDSGRGRP